MDLYLEAENKENDIQYIALRYNCANPESMADENTSPEEIMHMYPLELSFISFAYGEDTALKNISENTMLLYGNYFSKEQISGTSPYALLAANTLPGESDRMKSFEISGQKFDITGQISTDNGRDSFINFNAAEKTGIRPDSIEIKFDEEKIPELKIYKKYTDHCNKAQKYFNQYALKPWMNFQVYSIFDMLKDEWVKILTLLLSVLNFCSLYIYIFNKRQRTILIYRNYGATEKKCRFILYGEMFFITGSTYCISALILYYLLNPVIFLFVPSASAAITVPFFVKNFLFVCIILYFGCSPFVEHITKTKFKFV